MLKQFINNQRPDLNIYTANNNVYVFKQGQQITFKAVPVSESGGTLWLCRTQNDSAELLKKYGEITASKICEELNILFPTKE